MNPVFNLVCVIGMSILLMTACDRGSPGKGKPETVATSKANKVKKTGGGHGSHPTELEAGMVNPGYEEKPKWFKLSFMDIREDVGEATRAGKRLMLYFYQDGCPYCKKLLQDNFGQRDIAKKTRKHFDVVAINMWGSKEVTDFNGKTTNEKKFSRSLKVNFTPTILFMNEKGQVIMRINGYYYPHKFSALLDYIKDKKETSVRWAEYYKKVSPVAASTKLNFEPGFLKPPYNLQTILAKHKKPVMVLFEQTSCRSCDELHKDVLKRARTRAEMKNVSVVLVDMWSNDKIITPDGKETTVAKWAKKLDIKYTPSLVFFDVSGKEVFRTEAYLRAFHVHGAIAYVHEKAYLSQPNFQRYLAKRREILEKKEKRKIRLME